MEKKTEDNFYLPLFEDDGKKIIKKSVVRALRIFYKVTVFQYLLINDLRRTCTGQVANFRIAADDHRT